MVSSRGFTVIELIAVIGIMGILSAALLTRSSSFGGSIILRSLAYDVALSVREAQTYGISVRQTSTGTFGAGYGVEVRAASSNRYQLFSDLDDNGTYSGATELVTQYQLRQGYTISDLCYTPVAGTEVCSAQKLNITFHRPEPDAYILANDSLELNQEARLVVSSPDGSEVSVTIDATGQISVQ